jgi:hypothetical protein
MNDASSEPLSVEAINTLLRGASGASSLADFLAVAPIFDRALAEILAAIARSPSEQAWRPIGAEGRRAAEEATTWARATCEGRSHDVRSESLQRALAWMEREAARRSSEVERAFGGIEVEEVALPAGFRRISSEQRSPAMRRWIGPDRVTLFEAATLARRDDVDPLGVDLDAILALAYAQRTPEVPISLVLRHLVAIAPATSLRWLEDLIDEAAGRADLASMSHLITSCEERARERPFADAVSAEFVPTRLAQLRSRLEARLATIDDFYRTTRYFTRPTAHEPLELLLAKSASCPTPRPWLLQLHAPGGSGKTMLLRWLAARRCAPTGIPIARVDFDSYGLAPDLWEILLEIADLLDRHLPGRPFEKPLARFADERRELGQRPGLDAKARSELAARRQRSARARGQLDVAVLETLVSLFRTLPDPSVIIIDTLEEAILTHRTDLRSLLSALETLRASAPSLRVVLAGRYELTERDATLSELLKRHAETRRLEPFDHEDSLAFLASRGLPGSDPRAVEVATIAGGNPLRLALFAEFVASDPSIGATDLRHHAKADLIYVTERVISRIEPSLRWLVRYGVVPRELTFEFVSEVLRPFLEAAFQGTIAWDDPSIDLAELPPSLRRPLFVPTSLDAANDPWVALWRRLQEFASESSWIEPVPGDRERLVFHAVVRRPMLHLLDRHQVLRELHRRAAEHYRALAMAPGSQRNDAAPRAVFHLIRLGEIDGALQLMTSIAEIRSEQLDLRAACAREFLADAPQTLSEEVDRLARLEELDALALSAEREGETSDRVRRIEDAIKGLAARSDGAASDYRVLHARAIIEPDMDAAARLLRAAIQACPSRRRAGVLNARLARVSGDRRGRSAADESVTIAMEREGLSRDRAVPAESREIWHQAFATFNDRLEHGRIREGIQRLPSLDGNIRDPGLASETLLDWALAFQMAGLSDAATNALEMLLVAYRTRIGEGTVRPVPGIGKIVAAAVRSSLSPPWLFRSVAIQAPYLAMASILSAPTDPHRIGPLLEIVRFATLSLNESALRDASSALLAEERNPDGASSDADFSCLMAEHDVLRVGNVGRAESWLRRLAERVRSASPRTQLHARVIARCWESEAERRADFFPPELTAPVLRFATARAVDALLDLTREGARGLPRLLKALADIDAPTARAAVFEWCVDSPLCDALPIEGASSAGTADLIALLPVDDEFLDLYGTSLDRLRYTIGSAAAGHAIGARDLLESRLREAWIASDAQPLRTEPWFMLDLLRLAGRSGALPEEPSKLLARARETIDATVTRYPDLASTIALAAGVVLTRAGDRSSGVSLLAFASRHATNDARRFHDARLQLQEAIDAASPKSAARPPESSPPSQPASAAPPPAPSREREDPLAAYRADPYDLELELALAADGASIRATWRFLSVEAPARTMTVDLGSLARIEEGIGFWDLATKEAERILRWCASDLRDALDARGAMEFAERAARDRDRTLRVRIVPASPGMGGVPWEVGVAGRRTERNWLISRTLTPTRGASISEQRERERVRWLQRALTSLGWAKLSPDGIAGPETLAAVDDAIRKLDGSARAVNGSVEMALCVALRNAMPTPEVLLLTSASASSYADALYAKLGFLTTRHQGVRSVLSGERSLRPALLLVEADVLVGSRPGSVRLDLRGESPGPNLSSNRLEQPSRVGPEEIDLLLERMPPGERPLVVLTPDGTGTRSLPAADILARNEFASQLFQRGNAPAVLTLHQHIPPWAQQALATEFGKGATIEGAVITMRNDLVRLGGVSDEDFATGIALWCHDPRWRPTPGLRSDEYFGKPVA